MTPLSRGANDLWADNRFTPENSVIQDRVSDPQRKEWGVTMTPDEARTWLDENSAWAFSDDEEDESADG